MNDIAQNKIEKNNILNSMFTYWQFSASELDDKTQIHFGFVW